MEVAMRLMQRRSCARAMAWSLALSGCSAKEPLHAAEAGGQTTEGSSTEAGSSSGNAEGANESASESSGDSSGGMLDPACADAVGSDFDAVSLEFGDYWGSSELGGREWDGSCSITSVTSGVGTSTSLACDPGGESGPTTVSFVVPKRETGVAWAEGEVVLVRVVVFGSRSASKTLSMRRASDSSLLAAVVSGGDWDIVAEDFAPLSASADLGDCGYPPEPNVWPHMEIPFAVTFVEPDGDELLMLQGSAGVLAGAAGEIWRAWVPVAYSIGPHDSSSGTELRLAVVLDAEP
jgi:hypothetical protein